MTAKDCVRTYVLFTGIAAASAGTALFLRAPQFSWSYAQAVLCLGGIAVLAQLLGYSLGRAIVGTVSFVPLLAMAAIAPGWMSIVGVAVVTLIVQLFRPYPKIKQWFNIAQQSLAVSLATIVYLAAGGRSMLDAGALPYLPLFLLFLTYSIVNNSCVTGVVALSERRRFAELWSENALQTLPYDLLAWPVIVFLGWVYVHYRIPGALVTAVPILGLRQLYKVNSDLEKTNQELLELMVAAIEARDPYTSGHSRRVSENARIIAQIVGLRSSEVKRVETAALLHDVGKIHEVFAPILQKPGRLTEEENAVMQTHPIKSEELVARVSQLRDVVGSVRNHHENWDGTGYPDGLAGDKIPIASRIIMFADTVDAMTSDRPYRKALDAEAVRAELIKHRGRQFDPAICDTLLSSSRYADLFKHAGHTSLPHTQEVPKLRLALTR
ncbi:MAG: HD-GYP domain-containing protein [Gemmatimonadaceae bacterium]